MKTKFPLVAALATTTVWALLLIAIPLFFDVFKNCKVEMPALTMMVIQTMHFGGIVVIPATVLLTAFLLQ